MLVECQSNDQAFSFLVASREKRKYFLCGAENRFLASQSGIQTTVQNLVHRKQYRQRKLTSSFCCCCFDGTSKLSRTLEKRRLRKKAATCNSIALICLSITRQHLCSYKWCHCKTESIRLSESMTRKMGPKLLMTEIFFLRHWRSPTHCLGQSLRNLVWVLEKLMKEQR